MKRRILIATALFFLCATAIVFIAGHTFDTRASAPASVAPVVRYELPALHRIKRLLPQFAP